MLLLFPRAIGVSVVIAAILASAGLASPARAQDVAGGPAPVDDLDPGALDPASPLQALPDLGVEWPDLSPPAGEPSAAPEAAQTTDSAVQRRYGVTIAGIEAVADAARLRLRFDELSTLIEGEAKPANVAQIDRRAREDERTLSDLLQAAGYYDATAQARVEGGAGGGRIMVTISA
ncbi:MAG: hypothetical protein JWM38_2736, partial [Sphingomonas bacterium]|nr:hypothetical protein [Sphingomonas bacterium]